jgi:mono/diheme cytochrome c family protein
VAAGAEFERPGNASVPLALADTYDFAALVDFLRHPLRSRPAGRMPSHHLSEQEAADISAYLHVGRVMETAPARKLLGVAPQTAERGAEVFHEQRCANCHTPAPAEPLSMSQPMTKLKASQDAGCLSESPAPGVPRFDLNALQRRALTLALRLVQSQVAPILTAQERVDWSMSRLNCYACHDRDGKGGPEDPRVAYFAHPETVKHYDASEMTFPPTLDGIGARANEEDLSKLLTQPRTQPHPKLSVRMPDFGWKNVKPLAEGLKQADGKSK